MISELKLHNFRCFNSSTINLSPGINFFYGNNGSGKTSILEAIYMCSSGRSFKSSNIQSLISTDKNFFSINGYDSNRGHKLSISKEKSKSISIKINNTKTTTSNLIKEFPSTAIHNNTFSFADASPDFRRKILDRSLFVSDDSFSEIWFGFYRCLKQRNTLLKNRDVQNIDYGIKKFRKKQRILTQKEQFFSINRFLSLKKYLPLLITAKPLNT